MRTPDWSAPGIRLYQGDALDILRTIPDDSADALVTDPPYSSGGTHSADRRRNTITKYVQTGYRPDAVEFAGDNRDQRSYLTWCTLWLSQTLRIVRPGGVALVFSDWRQLPTTTDALQAGGWLWRGIVPWVKPPGAARPQKGRFTAQCEYVVWGSNGPLSPATGVADCLPGVVHGAAPRRRDHITQKPLDILRDLLRIVPPRSTVLDPFAGSGTTGVACLNAGHHWTGIEILPHNIDITTRRLQETLGQTDPHTTQTTPEPTDTAPPGEPRP
jgi:site-specific DNA-methyltransferase (adenine-specific)